MPSDEMFPISKSNRLRRECSITPLIVDRYEVIYENDGLPVLFTGVNKNGDRVVASSVDEDSAKKIERFFYVVVSTTEYLDFIGRKITYKDLIVAHEYIFVVDRKFSGEVTAVYMMNVDSVPKQYLPLDTSYYPYGGSAATTDKG